MKLWTTQHEIELAEKGLLKLIEQSNTIEYDEEGDRIYNDYDLRKEIEVSKLRIEESKVVLGII